MQLLHANFGAEPPPDDPPPPADEASLDGAFTDADPGGDVTLAVARVGPDGNAITGTAVRWTAPSGARGAALTVPMECPIVRADVAASG